MTRLRLALLSGTLLLALMFAPRSGRADCPPSQLFTPPIGYNSGVSPFHVLTSDFNADGVLDLALTDNGGSDIGIMFGIGNGAFHDAVTYPVPSGNGHLIAVDLDLDGILDIATNSAGTDRITVLKGRADGTFESAVSYPAGRTPYGIASADFNRDGIPDLAAANILADSVSILLGRPGGGYAAPYGFPVGNHPYQILAVDLNGDGLTDLVVTNQDGADVSVLMGQGVEGIAFGTFAPAVHYAVQTYPYSLALADFNHDGILDMAVANAGSGTVSILRGNGSGGFGDGTFGTATNLYCGVQPRSVVVGDINGDGIQDLVLADYAGTVNVMFGHGSGGFGDGTFAPPLTYSAGSSPTDVAIGDFNADTLPDLAVPNYLTHGVSVLFHGCGGPPPTPPSPAPTLTKVRDVPHDQGGRVFVTWLRSNLDGGPSPSITGYRVWRRIPPELALAGSGQSSLKPSREVQTRPITGPDGVTVTYWEALVTLPAEQLEGYGYTAPTTQDSMAGSNPYTAFFITALTSNPSVFYQSNVDSGYSVDNIPPAQPGGANAGYSQSVMALRWNSNREIDIDSYRVYRGTTPNFSIGVWNLLASQPDTTLADAQGSLGNFYKITAVDRHGNEGPAAPVTPHATTAVNGDRSIAFALRSVVPNPSRNGAFTVSFSLPSSSQATLILFDLAGRRMWDRLIAESAAGPHVFEVGRGTAIPAGVYLLQLSQSGRSATTRVVVSR